MTAINNKHILVLDKDNAMMGMVHDIMFYGYTDMHIVSNSLHLQLAAHACQPDLIILDFLSAEADGAELCRVLKADDQLKNVPLVVIAGHQHIQSNINGYCDVLLMSPTDTNKLAEQINYLIAS
ncbi:response regulator receiver domain-containing protein [Mucilaginibacter yixingensis]|uniref:Response regulator receiver domain-containing protein n=1 Tax=Mucilaginibacter yixingensis TaxID=1295612 RepID=A0A2T5JB23_9SPHI|nr:response regulator [Mucilaginibacter yixingensis]PTQ98066.1 response regulator receiver domain-containing protein [Mucilaginibacter yixingensis]